MFSTSIFRLTTKSTSSFIPINISGVIQKKGWSSLIPRNETIISTNWKKGGKNQGFLLESNRILGKSSLSLVPSFSISNQRFISSSVPRNEKQVNKWEQTRPLQGLEETELANITPAVREHLRNVYSTLASSIGVCGLATALSTMNGYFLSPGIGLIGGLGLVLGIGFTPHQYVMPRLLMLYSFAALEGLVFSPLLGAAAAYGAIAPALIGTASIFTGFTAVSLFAKSRSMLSLGGPLFGGLLGIVALQLSAFIFPSMGHLAHSVSLYGGLGLFSLYISYDTQRMIESARLGQNDFIGDALGMFLNLWNIFIRLIEMFGGRRD